MRSHRTLRLRARMGTASEHSGKSYLAQRPTRGCAAVRRGTRPRRCRHGLESKRPRRAIRVHSVARCSNARDAGRAGLPVCHVHCAGSLLGCLRENAELLAHTATTACLQALERGSAGRPALSTLLTPLPTCCEAKTGRNAPLGKHSWAPHAQPCARGKPGLATSLMAGSFTDDVPVHFTLAIACYRPAWSRLTRHCRPYPDRSISLRPEVMQIALRRRLRPTRAWLHAEDG